MFKNFLTKWLNQYKQNNSQSFFLNTLKKIFSTIFAKVYFFKLKFVDLV